MLWFVFGAIIGAVVSYIATRYIDYNNACRRYRTFSEWYKSGIMSQQIER